MTAQGRHGAVSVVALAEKGALFDPGPCMYMEKLAFGPQIDPELVSIDQPISFNLKVRRVMSSLSRIRTSCDMMTPGKKTFDRVNSANCSHACHRYDKLTLFKMTSTGFCT